MTRCYHPYCENEGTKTLRDNHRIECDFCDKHYEIYCKLPAWYKVTNLMGVTRTQHINEVNALRSQNKLK